MPPATSTARFAVSGTVIVLPSGPTYARRCPGRICESAVVPGPTTS